MTGLGWQMSGYVVFSHHSAFGDHGLRCLSEALDKYDIQTIISIVFITISFQGSLMQALFLVVRYSPAMRRTYAHLLKCGPHTFDPLQL
jgi:hypothetical protein